MKACATKVSDVDRVIIDDRHSSLPTLQLSRSVKINLLLIYFTILYDEMGRSARCRFRKAEATPTTANQSDRLVNAKLLPLGVTTAVA
jgi:hypothetical protein